ncbi:MAG: hypothetical protein DI530_15045 [Sphingomonas sp.]|uniref:hypothetical protein n=1 Tax=Sphingomonas sp. TaxID=28214 RepID=UPI000DBC24FC|nr:hypothetical protein [Sphingomonas sp.]PZU75568.1 MAG: hypothetical protein DI530_15045 [Sphingomonas sp.]
MAPCLTLTGGVGMTRDARREWYAAAYRAMDGIPADLLRRGAAVAMSKADHPSKIVPAIMAEIGAAWGARRNGAAALAAIWAGADNSPFALPAPGAERPNEDEVTAICRRFAVGRFSPHSVDRDPAAPAPVGAIRDEHRPSRVPTREDYIRMGVDPAVLDTPPPAAEQAA